MIGYRGWPMIDVATIANGLSWPIKIGWAVWLVWASVLVEWYWRGRSMRTDRLSRRPPDADRRPPGSGCETGASDSSTAAA